VEEPVAVEAGVEGAAAGIRFAEEVLGSPAGDAKKKKKAKKTERKSEEPVAAKAKKPKRARRTVIEDDDEEFSEFEA
jgi:hypothetical protein